MFLTVFIVFMVLAFTLVTLGLFKPDHTELSVIGFVFIFLLALVVLNNNLEVKVGTNITSNFSYSKNADNLTLLTSSHEENVDIYEPVDLDGNLDHLIGYWLAVGGVLGLVGIFLSLRHSRGYV